MQNWHIPQFHIHTVMDWVHLLLRGTDSELSVCKICL